MGGFPSPEITWWIGTRRLKPEKTVTVIFCNEQLGGGFHKAESNIALAYGGNTTLNKDLVIDIFSLL